MKKHAILTKRLKFQPMLLQLFIFLEVPCSYIFWDMNMKI